MVHLCQKLKTRFILFTLRYNFGRLFQLLNIDVNFNELNRLELTKMIFQFLYIN